jgi:hypothetical protein
VYIGWNQGAENRAHRHANFGLSTRGRLRTADRTHLVAFGEQIVSALTRPEVIRMTRLMADCADTHARLAATFYTTGFGEMAKRVAAFLKTLAKRRDLSINDPDLKAEQLIAAWLGMSERRQSLGVAGPPRRMQLPSASATPQTR